MKTKTTNVLITAGFIALGLAIIYTTGWCMNALWPFPTTGFLDFMVIGFLGVVGAACVAGLIFCGWMLVYTLVSSINSSN